jgi:DNA-binding CsgD family transcriptional regulator
MLPANADGPAHVGPGRCEVGWASGLGLASPGPLIAEGRSNQAIGERLDIVTKTVETHVNAIFSKLGLERADEDNRRVLAVLAYLRQRASTEASTG